MHLSARPSKKLFLPLLVLLFVMGLLQFQPYIWWQQIPSSGAARAVYSQYTVKLASPCRTSPRAFPTHAYQSKGHMDHSNTTEGGINDSHSQQRQQQMMMTSEPRDGVTPYGLDEKGLENVSGVLCTYLHEAVIQSFSVKRPSIRPLEQESSACVRSYSKLYTPASFAGQDARVPCRKRDHEPTLTHGSVQRKSDDPCARFCDFRMPTADIEGNGRDPLKQPSVHKLDMCLRHQLGMLPIGWVSASPGMHRTGAEAHGKDRPGTVPDYHSYRVPGRTVAAFSVWGGSLHGLVCELMPWIGYHAQLGIHLFYVLYSGSDTTVARMLTALLPQHLHPMVITGPAASNASRVQYAAWRERSGFQAQRPGSNSVVALQMYGISMALKLAEAQQVQWLLHIDTDERMAHLDYKKGSTQWPSLATYLASLHPHNVTKSTHTAATRSCPSAVRFMNFEVQPMTPMLTPPPTRGLIEGSLSGEGCACRFCQATLLRTNAYFMHPSLRLFRQLFLLGGPVDPNVSYAGPRAPKGRDSSSSSSKESSSNSSGSFCKNSSVDVNSVSDNRSGSSSLDSWLKLYANGKSAVHVHACGVRPRGPHSFTGTAAAKEAVPPNSNSSGPPSSRIGEVSSSNGVHGVRTDDSRASGDPSESSCNAWGGELVSKEWVVLHYAMLVPQDVIRRCASAQAWQDPVLPFQQAACAAVNRYKGNTARAAAAAGAVFLHHLELSESSYVQCTRSAVRDVKTAVKHLCTAVDSNNCSTLVTSSSTSRTGSGHCQHARPLRVNKGTLKEAGQGSHHGEVSSQAGVPGSASCRHISGIGTEHGWCRLHAVHERLIPLLEQAGLLRQLHMVADWHQHTSLCI